MDSTSETDANRRSTARQQEVLAALGKRALESDDLDRLIGEATADVADALEVEYAAVLELDGKPHPDRAVEPEAVGGDDELRLRRGTGWPADLEGSATVPSDPGRFAGYALRADEPVVVSDLAADDRVAASDLLESHDVVAGIAAAVGPSEDPWGVLGVYATEPREFSAGEEAFVRDVADLLAAAVEEAATKRRLRERERELEETFERITDAFIGLDRSWEITYINDRGAELLDPDGRGLVGENFWDPFEPALGTTFEEEYRETMGGTESTSFEAYYPPLETWFEVHAYPSESGLSIYFRDATERKERERDLELFRTLLDHSHDSVLVIDPETGRYLDVNATACRRRGYSRQELLELSVPAVETRFDDLADWRSFVEELRSEGQATFDGEHRRKDGSTYPVEVNATYVELEGADGVEADGGPDRNRAYVLATARDVTERRRRERELEESERRYRTLAECFPNGIVTLFDDDLEYTLAAGQGFDHVSLDPDDLEGQSVRGPWDEDTADALESAARSVLDGDAESLELAYAGREWRIQMVPITDESDAVFAGMTMAQDVTERKEIRRRLEESERRYRTLAEHFPNGAVAVYDADLRYQLVQGALLDGPLPDRETLEGETIHEVFPQEVTADLEPLLRAAVEDGVTDSETFEYADRHWRVWATPLRDAGDDVFAGLSFTQDITDQVERERALQESRNQLRALVDVLPVGVLVAQDDGEIVEWNEAAAEVWGGIVESGSIAEYDEYDGWWADTGDPVAPEEWPLARALRGEEVTDPDEIEIEGFDGERRTVLIHGMPVRDADGEVSRAVVTLVDITERREYQRKLEESNERLEQFAYAASHDLQEPLRMVSSYLSLIESRYADDLDADGREFIEYAVDGAERMREMIDGLLAYSRVDTQGDPLEPVELAAVLESALENLEVKIEERDAEITIDPLPRVRGDESQLRQLFQNLLSNAIEYAGEESPRIHVGVERAGSRWKLSVRDEGIGIDPADADRIFEVFQRLHSHEDHAGTGIGLALCRRIVERHGGEIRVDSEPGEWTTFTFTLPAAEELEE